MSSGKELRAVGLTLALPVLPPLTGEVRHATSMDLVDVEASVVDLLQVPFKVQETSVSGCVELVQ